MQLQQAHCNIVIGALLFMAEKYRLIVGLADRFDDGGISDAAATAEREARRLSTTVTHSGVTTLADAERIGVACAGYADALNRQMQRLNQNGQVQDAALIEHNLRQLYDAIPAVEAVATTLRAEGVTA